MTTIASVTRQPFERLRDLDLILEPLPLIAAGLSNPQIATRLHLSTDGAKSRMRALFHHLGAINRAHAVAIGYQRGLLNPTHRAQLQHRDLADRHASTCALLRAPVCDCKPAKNGSPPVNHYQRPNVVAELVDLERSEPPELSDTDVGHALRDVLGRVARETWIEWANEQPHPLPSWLIPWQDLDDTDREAYRRLGDVLADPAEATRRAVLLELARVAAVARRADATIATVVDDVRARITQLRGGG